MTTLAHSTQPVTTARNWLSQGVRFLTTPLLPADFLDLVNPLRAGADLRARVVSMTHETKDAVTVRLHPGKSWQGHVPGQYVRIGIDVDGVRQWRTYSITSVPHDGGGDITITVKAIPDGRVSNHIVGGGLRVGELIMMDQATGDFVVDVPAPPKVLFITAGSGVTPVMGMLRGGAVAGADVVHVHAAPSAPDVIFGGELRGLHARGAITLHEWHSDDSGVITTDDIKRLVPDWDDRATWVCGPKGLIDACEERWAAHELSDALHIERFRPNIVVSGQGGHVTFAATGKAVDADGGTPLLTVGEDADVPMPSGCRMGVCYGCVAKLKLGTVRDLRTGDLTAATGDDDVPIQTCVSAAAGDCTIEL